MKKANCFPKKKKIIIDVCMGPKYGTKNLFLYQTLKLNLKSPIISLSFASTRLSVITAFLPCMYQSVQEQWWWLVEIGAT